MIDINNIDDATNEVSLQNNNFRIVKVSDSEIVWKDRKSDKILAVMTEKDGTLNFKRLWRQNDEG